MVCSSFFPLHATKNIRPFRGGTPSVLIFLPTLSLCRDAEGGEGAARRHRNIYRNLIQPGQEQKNCFQARDRPRGRGRGGEGWARKESHRSRAAQTQPRPRHPQPLATRPILLSPRPTPGYSNFSLPSSLFPSPRP